MNRVAGIALLVGGLLLLVLGFNESQSTASDVSRLITNSPTDRSLWFLVGGGIATAAGLFLILAKRR